MSIRNWLPGLLLLLLIRATNAEYAFETLKANYASGQLTYEQYLVYSALNIFNPSQVPERYRLTNDELPLKSGTFLIQEIKTNWSRLSPTSQKLLASYLQRPVLPDNILSPGRRFRIHYTTTGADKVDPADNNRNKIPDFVDWAAKYFDHTHKIIVDSLGYQPPPPDSSGSGKEYDVYIISLKGVYGITTLEEFVPGKQDAYSSYIEVDNDFIGFFKTQPLEALMVTTAHEYFHAVQLGYRYRDEDKFFLEMCSTWMEDLIYDQVNDYTQYLDSFFSNINYPFYYTNDLFEYASCLWIHMITRKYGTDAIRKIWDYIPFQTAFAAMQSILVEYGTTFSRELISFGLWNYFTKSRADTINYYPEGHLYPEVKFKKTNEIQQNSITAEDRICKLSSIYYQISDIIHGDTIRLIITDFAEPDKNAMTEDRNDIQFNVVSISEIERRDSTFFRRNNLVKLTEHIGIQFSADDEKNFFARAVIQDANNNQKIMQFFPPFFITEREERNFINNVYPNPLILGQNDPLIITYVVSEKKVGEIAIYTAEGLLVIKDEFDASTQNYRIFDWDGRNENGELVSSGVYIVLLRVGGFVDLKKVAVVRR